MREASPSSASENDDGDQRRRERSPVSQPRSAFRRCHNLRDHYSILSNSSRYSDEHARSGSRAPPIPPRGLSLREERDYLGARVPLPCPPPHPRNTSRSTSIGNEPTDTGVAEQSSLSPLQLLQMETAFFQKLLYKNNACSTLPTFNDTDKEAPLPQFLWKISRVR